MNSWTRIGLHKWLFVYFVLFTSILIMNPAPLKNNCAEITPAQNVIRGMLVSYVHSLGIPYMDDGSVLSLCCSTDRNHHCSCGMVASILMQKLEHTYMGYFEISCLRILSRFLLMMNERRSVMKMLTMKNLRYSPGCYISPFHPDQP